jgi:hypothetical protein
MLCALADLGLAVRPANHAGNASLLSGAVGGSLLASTRRGEDFTAIDLSRGTTSDTWTRVAERDSRADVLSRALSSRRDRWR